MNRVLQYYDRFDEWGRLDREPIEFEINLRHIIANLPERGGILDNGAGPGKYAVALAKRGYDVTVSDFSPRLVEQARSKAEEEGVASVMGGFRVADARDLSLFGDETFDACLTMGPMYHLQSADDRKLALSEMRRVTRSGGLAFVAFMSKLRHLAVSLADPLVWKPHDEIPALEAFMRTGVYDHPDEGRFTGVYFADIGSIVPGMESAGFECVKLIGSSGAGNLSAEQWRHWERQGEESAAAAMRLMLEASESPYLFGSSSHLLYIGRKK
ncbi:class I SAM-dependent methyltransferase [Cohnella suwonensis]|uniref:Class I SAM-dependent methyltransferase n=1 Tax=Cohnella suwonensis TaxID=696072 RepID=A0ABW0M3R7_9BACL